jgi:hypothetical protein
MDPNRESSPVLSFVFPCTHSLDLCRWFVAH